MTTTAAPGSVAVGYDGTPHSDVALAWAVRHAVAVGRPLLVVHATGSTNGIAPFENAEAHRQELRVAGRQVLDHGLSRAMAVDRSVVLREHLGVGSAREVLLDSASGAHLLVLGTRGHGRLASYLLGSVSAGVSSAAPCPVAVVRTPRHADPLSVFAGHVVVGVDGTDLSQRALLTAFEHASWEQRPLAILHSWDTSAVRRDLDSYEVLMDTAEQHDLQVGEALAGFGEKFPDVQVTVHQNEWDPGPALVEASRHADLVVVGSRGRGDTAAVLLGSVSRYLIEHGHCPVIVAREDQPRS